jgi:hypothetical protein
MMGQKTKIATAVILAILFASLLVGISYILFPIENQQPPIPGPGVEPEYLLGEISWAIFFMSLAALVATLVAVTVLILKRDKRNINLNAFNRKKLTELYMNLNRLNIT